MRRSRTSANGEMEALMKKKNTWLALAERAILEEGRPLTPTQIVEIIDERYEKQTKSLNPGTTVAARLHLSVKNDPKSIFERVEDENGYVAYKLKDTGKQTNYVNDETNDVNDEQTNDVNNKQKNNANFHKSCAKESRRNERRDLHPLLVHHQFNSNNETYLKTIRHEASVRNFGKIKNEYVFPDLVGVNLIGPLHKSVYELVRLCGNLSSIMKISSYEVKWELTESCYMEKVSQCLNNSKWANECWLAAFSVSFDPVFLQELKRFNDLYGIGFIQLSAQVGNSQVIYPAVARPQFDAVTVDRLCGLNPDFKEFVETVTSMASIQEPLKEKFDVILDDDELEEHINNVLKNKIK